MLTIWSNLQQECQTRATRVRHKQHKRNTSEIRATRARHKCNTSATWMTRVRHKYNTCAKRTIRVQHEWKILILITTWVKTYFYSYIYYTASDKLQGVKQFHSIYYLRKYLIPMPKCVWKVHHKLDFVMVKAVSLDCGCKFPCTFPHSYA